MKRQSLSAKLVILLSGLSVLFLVLAVVSSVWSVNTAIAAIDEIGAVEYSQEVRAQIDSANERYQSLDRNLGLQSWVTNSSRLLAAKSEFARLAIKEAYLALENGEPEEKVLSLAGDAWSILEAYFTEDEYGLVSNYADLEAVTEHAGASDAESAGTPAEESGGEEEIEIC